MKRYILAAAALLGFSEFAPARAQFVIGPICPSGYGYSYSYRSGIGFSVGGSRFRLSGFAGGFGMRSEFFVPPPFNPYTPFWRGWGPAFGPPVFAVPVPVVVPVPVPVPVEVGREFPERDPEPLPLPLPPRQNPGARLPQNDFLVIAPRKEVTIPEVTRVEPPRKPSGPIIAFDPFRAPAPVKAEVPEADPKKEALRLLLLARVSFAAGDYGRAAEHFDRAIAADPTDAKLYFLYSQAKFAAGEYTAAVVRIRQGLERDAKWPTTNFDPTSLYADRPERFVLHLMALKKAINENPEQATLEFLLGYQLWFSGDKAEAARWFRAAEKRLAAPGPIALFK